MVLWLAWKPPFSNVNRLHVILNPGMASEIAALRKECGELRERLAGAEARNGTIRQNVGKVSEEIAETIADLDSLLEK